MGVVALLSVRALVFPHYPAFGERASAQAGRCQSGADGIKVTSDAHVYWGTLWDGSTKSFDGTEGSVEPADGSYVYTTDDGQSIHVQPGSATCENFQ
jgi:hypothetical protein